jgi:sulfide:quinone oxidoreductase
MARVIVMGAGISGHTAALYLQRELRHKHQIIVVSPAANYNWIPSNIWVGVGRMDERQVKVPLRPVYDRKGIEFHQALGVAIRPFGDESDPTGAIDIVYTDPARAGHTAQLRYDYLINATGPKLNFAATPGLGPEGNSLSVCTADHATQTAKAFAEIVEAMKRGERKRLVVGVGHGGCTCEGAAFEYTFNVEHELRQAGVREMADLTYLTNEYELGDFGVDGLAFDQQGFVSNSKLWTESLFRERGVKAIAQAHVSKVDPGVIHYEQLDGTTGELAFDFAMLLPPFRGVDLKGYDRAGEDISEQVFAPSGFMRVDADYHAKPYEEWTPEDWPKTYQSVVAENVFGVGIAFAPPHPISRSRTSTTGTVISPAPPRTGMPSGVMGRTVAHSIARRIKEGSSAELGTASMASMGAACIASAGTGMREGSAASMTMYPIVPDRATFPESGRDLKATSGEIGLAGHWTKLMLHYLFIYKAKARPFWYLIPE